MARLIGESPLSFREFLTREPLPLATIHDGVFEFLLGRDDAVLCGAHAVNLYVGEFRATDDVDVLSTRATAVAREIAEALRRRFEIDVAVRERRDGGCRIEQVRRPENRRLADVWPVHSLPETQRVGGFLVLTPTELVAAKISVLATRLNRPKSGTDRRDLAVLLLRFPELKPETGPVRDRLMAAGASADVLAAWNDIVAQEIQPEDEDAEFGG